MMGEKTAPPASEAEAIKWLASTLRDLPLTVEPLSGGPRSRADVVIRVGDDVHYLEMKSARGGWPTSVRDLITRPEFSSEHTVLYAHSFSPGAVDLMAKSRVNWVDSSGNVRLTQWPSLVVEKLDTRQRPAPNRSFRWNPSGEDIAEWVLTHPDERFSVTDLAARQAWSNPQVSRILSGFDRLAWTERTGGLKGRGVSRKLGSDRGEMLDSWSELVSSQDRSMRRLHALGPDLLGRVAEAFGAIALDQDSPWAFAGLAGAQVLRASLTSVPTVDVAVSSETFESEGFWQQLRERGLRPAGEGGAIGVQRLGKRAMTHATTNEGLPVLSAPRIYAALFDGGGRAAEVATDIRDVVIGF